jgi:hypothetical protein
MYNALFVPLTPAIHLRLVTCPRLHVPVLRFVPLTHGGTPLG